MLGIEEGHMSTTQARRQAKDELFDAFASIARALASGRRVEILELLALGEELEDLHPPPRGERTGDARERVEQLVFRLPAGLCRRHVALLDAQHTSLFK